MSSNEELLADLSGRFVRTLPLRQGKAGELDELMSLFAPSAFGVGLEGIEIEMGCGNLVVGCFGAELFFSGNRSGFPEHSRLCMTRCFGLCDYRSAKELSGPALQRAAVLSQVFIALANPRDKLSWISARATARAAKARGAFVLLVAVKREYVDDWDFVESAMVQTDPDDTHCLLRAELQDPLLFLETFAWALVPALARYARDDEEIAGVRQMLEKNHATIMHVIVSKKRSTLSKAVSCSVDCYRIGLDDIKDIIGVIVVIDNRDYPDSTPEALSAEVKSALPGISPVHVVVTKITDGEAHPEPCTLNSYHDFLVIVLFDPTVLQKKQAGLAANF